MRLLSKREQKNVNFDLFWIIIIFFVIYVSWIRLYFFLKIVVSEIFLCPVGGKPKRNNTIPWLTLHIWRSNFDFDFFSFLKKCNTKVKIIIVISLRRNETRNIMCTNATLSYIDQNCVQSLFPKCFLYALHYDRSGTRKSGFWVLYPNIELHT